MTTKTGQLIYDDEGDGEFPSNSVARVADIAENSGEFNLKALLSRMGTVENDGLVTVRRAGPTGRGNKGRSAYLFECSASEFSEDILRDNYGGGVFRLFFSNNKTEPDTNCTIEVEAPKISPFPTASALPVTVDNGKSEMIKMIEVMQSGFNQLGQLIAQNMRAPENNINTRRELMQDMAMMKELFAPRESAVNSADQSINMLMKGLELARDISPREGEAGTADIILEALKTFGKPIAEAAMSGLKNLPVSPQLNTPWQPPNNSNAIAGYPVDQITGQHLNSAPSPSLNPTSEIHAMMEQYANTLLELARADKDPYAYAVLLCDSAPIEEIKTMIDRPDIIPYVVSLNSDLGAHVEWITEFIAAIRECLTGEEEAASVTEINIADNTPHEVIPDPGISE